MENFTPRVMENREFVGLEEEDIQRLNRDEAGKFEQNPNLSKIMASLEEELGNNGHWEEHWLTIDASGRRVYAKIYYGAEKALAMTSDGRIIRELDYPPGNQH
jgi:ABC-type dipeptide/oligopeptide/nickel transport system permease subunit